MKKSRGGYTMALVDVGCDYGRKRRVKVIEIDGIKGFSVKFTAACSGCSDDRENVSCVRGSGCEECGYTGLRRRDEWVPLNGEEMAKQEAKWAAQGCRP